MQEIRVTVNNYAVNAGEGGALSAEGEPANKNIKKAKKGKLNYLPNFPEGFAQASLEGARKDLVDEMQKRAQIGQLVKQMMDLTFASRRKEMVESEPAISMMVEHWPALLTEDRVCSREISSYFCPSVFLLSFNVII